MAHTYQPVNDDPISIVQKMERQRKVKVYLVFASLIALAIGSILFMQIAQTSVLPYH